MRAGFRVVGKRDQENHIIIPMKAIFQDVCLSSLHGFGARADAFKGAGVSIGLTMGMYIGVCVCIYIQIDRYPSRRLPVSIPLSR